MILVVDDNATNLLLMSTLARKVCPKGVVTFADPVAALDWCQTHSADLVIVDYMMPHIDGHEFIERFRRVPNSLHTPVVMVTAADESPVRQRALTLGATDFISKPIDNAEFVLRTKNLLALSQAMSNMSRQVRMATAELETREAQMVEAISQAAEFRDPETGAHTQRVGRYAHLIALRLGIQEPYLSDILKAAPMHDLGKIGVSDAILLKPGKLTVEEFQDMKKHPEFGFKIANKSASPIMKLAAEISLSHHEKFDGSGYPHGLAGEAIPLSGRIVALADVFDALTTTRPYKKPWSVEDAQTYMKGQVGSHFCPRCSEAFFSSWSEVLEIKKSLPD